MTGDLYIHVVGWDTFQHGATRENPWIKDYIAQLHKDEFLDLSFHLRGVLQSVRLSYAASHRQLRYNTATLKRQLGCRVTTRDIDSLVDAGFLTLSASKVLAQSRGSKKRVEKKPPLPPLPPLEEEPDLENRNVAWDWIVSFTGEPLNGQRATYGRLAADLNELLSRSLPDASPETHRDELERRKQALVEEWGAGKATVRALIKHWKLAGTLARTAPGEMPGETPDEFRARIAAIDRANAELWKEPS